MRPFAVGVVASRREFGSVSLAGALVLQWVSFHWPPKPDSAAPVFREPRFAFAFQLRLIRRRSRLGAMKLAALAFLAGALALAAQEYTSERPPVLIKKILACYTDEARRAQLEGLVVLRADIGVDGVPKSIKVSRALGMGLDQNAIAAVKGWRFKPGEKHGEPVVWPVTIEVNFRVSDPSQSCHPGGPNRR
jgi:TonB family protein